MFVVHVNLYAHVCAYAYAFVGLRECVCVCVCGGGSDHVRVCYIM